MADIEYDTPTLRSSLPEVLLRKGIFKLCCKLTGEHPCQSAISKELQSTGLANNRLVESTSRNIQDGELCHNSKRLKVVKLC